jgi:Cu2+-exporting ATPase
VDSRFKDELRPDAVEVVWTLRSRGLDIALLFSDRMAAVPATAADVSQMVGAFVFQREGQRLFWMPSPSRRYRVDWCCKKNGLALAYNAVAVTLAVMWLVTPLIAAIAMSSPSLIVTLNSVRLKLDGGMLGR